MPDHSAPHVTISIPRGGGHSPITLGFAPIWLWIGGLLVVALLAAGAAAAVTYVQAMGKLREYSTLAVEVETLRKQNQAVKELETELKDLRGLQQQMLHLAGIQAAMGNRDTLSGGLPGAAPESLGADAGELLFWPLDGPILRDFSSKHPGVDIEGRRRKPVVAAGDGVVTRAGRDKALGFRLVLTHGDSLRTVYANDDLILVALGDSVEAGQVIALVGTGPEGVKPHLHFEVWRGGRPVPPRSVIPQLFPND